MRIIAIVTFMFVAAYCSAAGHGPVFGLATPTNSQGEWSFDSGLFGRSSDVGSQASFRERRPFGGRQDPRQTTGSGQCVGPAPPPCRVTMRKQRPGSGEEASA